MTDDFPEIFWCNIWLCYRGSLPILLEAAESIDTDTGDKSVVFLDSSADIADESLVASPPSKPLPATLRAVVTELVSLLNHKDNKVSLYIHELRLTCNL